MVTIELINESIETEPGPNFYWRGQPIDYLKIVSELHPLGVNNGVGIKLNELANIKVASDYKVIARSSENGDAICKIEIDKILIDLDCSIWRRVLGLMLTISFQPSHNFIEFDDMNLRADANFIVSSV